MPNFLSKLFRGKNEGGKKKPKKKKPSKKEKSSLFNKNSRPSDREDLNDLSDVPTVIDGGARRPSFTGTTGSTRGSSLGRESTKANMSSQSGVLSPRNKDPALQPFGNMQKAQKQHEHENHGFDENDFGDHGADENRDRSNVELGSPTVPRLSHQQLQQFNQQHSDPHSPNALPGPSGLYQQSGMGPSVTGKNMQLSRLSTGQLVAMENMSSPVSSSDFCLSTDAEDNEYNAMKHGNLGPPPPHPQGPAGSQYYSGGGGVGGGSALGSPMSYTTDEENSLFPALQTDDEGDPTPNAKHSSKAQAHTGIGQVPTDKNVGPHTQSPHPDDEPGRINMTIQPMVHETEADMRAWTPSPTSGTHSPRDGQTKGGSGVEQQQRDVKVTNSPRFTFQDEDELPSKKRERESGVDRPPSPVPGFAGLTQTVRCNEASTENNAFPETTAASPREQAQMATSLGNGSPPEMYPDSTDSEFEPLTASPKEGAAKVHLEKASSLLPTQTIVNDVPPSSDPQTSLALVEKKGEQEEGEAPPNFFADFDGATFPSETTSQDDPFAISSIGKNEGQRSCDSSRVNLLVETARSFSPDKKRQTSRRKLSSSASASNATSPLSQLLAQAKEKRSSRNRNKQSSSSVNSAPVITASYLRQQHNLKPLADRQDSDSPRSMTDHRHKGGKSSSRNTSVTSRHRSSRLSSARDHHADVRSHHSNTEANSAVSAAKDKLKKRRKEKEAAEGVLVPASKCSSQGKSQLPGGPSDDENSDNGEAWLFEEVADTLGPRGIAADMESLGGRSNRSGRSKNSTGNKSHRSHRSHRSHKSRGERSHRSSRRHRSSNESIDSRNSRNSRNSRYSHRSTRSHLSHMSEQSRSVANDLLRLEMQLAMVGSQDNNDDGGHSKARSSSSIGGNSVGGTSIGGASRTSRASRASTSISARRAAAIHKRSKITVIAPPGKLGIILANKADSKGTVVSGVRTSSVLAEKISPGDRITAIDGEDVSRMTVSEITTIMARKSDFERTLTVLTTPKQLSVATGSSSSMGQGQVSKSPTRGGEYGGSGDVDSLAGSSVANSSFSYRH